MKLIQPIISAIKRINERLQDIRRAVNKGELPQNVQDQFEAAVKIAAGDYLTKSGLISHGKKAVENIATESLENLQKRKTRGQERAEIREKAAKEFDKEEVTEEELGDYIDMVNTVREAADSTDKVLSDAIMFYGEAARHGKNTPYTVLYNALERYNALSELQKERVRKSVADNFVSTDEAEEIPFT